MRLRNTLVTVLVPILLVGAMTFAAVEIATPNEAEDDLDRYLPLEPGMTWTYAVTTNGEPTGYKTAQVAEHGPLFGEELGEDFTDELLVQSVTQEDHWDDLFGRPSRATTYLVRRGNSILSIADRSYGEDLQLTEPSATVLKLPLEVGTSWSFKGTQAGTKSSVDSEIVSHGPTTVSGLDFPDCFEIASESRFMGGDEVMHAVGITSWICRGIGIVRFIEDAPSLDVRLEQELVAFVGPDERLLAASAPEPSTRPEAVGTHNAYVSLDGTLDLERLAWSMTFPDDSNFPMVMDGDIALLSNDSGWVSAWDTVTGDELWTLRLSPPLVVPPVIAEGTVFLSDADKSLFAVDLRTGSTRWWKELPDIAASPALTTDGIAVSITQDRTARAFDIRTGALEWDEKLDDFPRYPGVIAGQAIIIPLEDQLVAISSADGSSLWNAELEAPVNAPLAADDEVVVVGDDSSALTALDVTDGTEIWDRILSGYRLVYSTPALGSDEVLFTTEESGGRDLLTAVSRRDGEVAWESELPSDVTQPPLIVGEQAVVVTDRAEVVQLNLDDGATEESTALRTFMDDNDTEIELPAVIAGDELIVPVEKSTEYLATTHYAFSLGEEPVEAPRLTAELVLTTESPLGGVVPLDGEVAVGTFSSTVIAASPGALPRLVTELDARPLTVDGSSEGLLVAAGPKLAMVDPATGAERWSSEFLPGSGSRPAITNDAVFVLNDAGVVALDGTTGKPRWARPLQGVGIHEPAIVDGDVLVAKGGLHRLNGSTGETIWQIPELNSFTTPATTEGVGLVHAYDIRADKVGLFAFDVGTGEVLWESGSMGSAFLAGIAAEDGVFVAGDDKGVVTAYRADNGDELWSVQLRTALDATPLVSDGIVGLVEKGRSENVRSSYFRVRYHDLVTGRFLGSIQPNGVSFTLGVTNSVGDRIYVPQTGGILVLKLVRT